MLLVLPHCCKTSRKAMLRVLPILNHAKKFTTNSPISFIFNFKSRDMSRDHDYTFGTKRPQDTHLRKNLSFNSWYASERYCKTSIFFSVIFVKLRIKRIEHRWQCLRIDPREARIAAFITCYVLYIKYSQKAVVQVTKDCLDACRLVRISSGTCKIKPIRNGTILWMNNK